MTIKCVKFMLLASLFLFIGKGAEANEFFEKRPENFLFRECHGDEMALLKDNLYTAQRVLKFAVITAANEGNSELLGRAQTMQMIINMTHLVCFDGNVGAAGATERGKDWVGIHSGLIKQVADSKKAASSFRDSGSSFVRDLIRTSYELDDFYIAGILLHELHHRFHSVAGPNEDEMDYLSAECLTDAQTLAMVSAAMRAKGFPSFLRGRMIYHKNGYYDTCPGNKVVFDSVLAKEKLLRSDYLNSKQADHGR